jgi:hypothetical protein
MSEEIIGEETAKTYRLLKEGEIIMRGDEFLHDDCVTWSLVRNEIGVRWLPGVLQPMRRSRISDLLAQLEPLQPASEVGDKHSQSSLLLELLSCARRFEFNNGIFVQWRGPGRWVVADNFGEVYSSSNGWEHEPMNSNRTDEFKARGQYTLGEAVRLVPEATLAWNV